MSTFLKSSGEELKVALTRKEKIRPESTSTLLEEIRTIGPEYIAAKKRFQTAAGQRSEVIVDESKKKRRLEINARPWRESCNKLSAEEEKLHSDLIRLDTEYKIQRNELISELEQRKQDADKKMIEQQTILENSLRNLYPQDVIDIAITRG